jgi:hypothetical protein
METHTSPLEVVERSTDRSLFSNSAISLHLQSLGYPQKSINSMLMCGKVTGSMLKNCDCGSELITLKHRCNLRTCVSCAKNRKLRLRRKYAPFLSSLHQDRDYSLYFLTISPKNYEDLEKGMEHIRKSFIKFLRLNYIKKRVKAGLYVLETKQSKEYGWNIHIHCIVYGRRLDNQIRGRCFNCSQNLIKQDYITKKYYCANRKCNSENVMFHQNSRIVDLFKSSSKRDVNIHISKQDSSFFSLNYMLKYISANKDDFLTPLDMAKYIKATYKRKLINVFGIFFKHKFGKIKCICWRCNKEIEFCYDYELIMRFQESIKPPNKNILSV